MEQKYCDNNQFLPLSLCNFSKLENMNREIFKRNFPSEKLPITYDFRPNYNICKGCEDSIDNQSQRTHIVNGCNINNIQNIFNPGNGTYNGYSKAINIETDLQNINRKETLCPQHKHQLDPNCIICQCDKSIGFCDTNMNRDNYNTQIIKKNAPTCEQKYVTANKNKKEYSYYPSENITDVGIINPSYNKSSLINNKNKQIINENNKNILNIEKKNINLCSQSQNLPLCRNNNYMRGYFIGSCMSDVKAKENGFVNINNGCNKWEKYKSVLNDETLKEYDVEKNNFNTLPFGLGSYGIPHNDYLSNEQQCQNLYNNMTRSKSLYGKPFVK